MSARDGHGSRPPASPRLLSPRQLQAALEVAARIVDLGERPAPTVTETMTAALRAVGVHPAIVHAFAQTGMLVSELNQDLWTGPELARWDAALETYRAGRYAAR